MSITGLPGNIPHQGLKERNPPELHISKTRAPTSTDSGAQFDIGDIWIDLQGDDAYILVSKDQGVAIWVLMAAVGSGVQTLTGDSGGAVSPDGANNIDILGGDGIDTTGNPGTNTITISTSSDVAISFPVDNGGPAIPSAGNLSLFGASSSDFPTSSGIETHVGATLDEIYLENRRYTSEFIVDANTTVGSRGEFSTISAALAVASAGDTIYVRPGTYVENLTLVAGVHIIGLTTSGSTQAVTLDGSVTANYTGKADIQGINIAPTLGDAVISTIGTAELVFIFCDLSPVAGVICASANADLTLVGALSNFNSTAGNNILEPTAGTYFLIQSFTNTAGGSIISAEGTSTINILECIVNHPVETADTAIVLCSNSFFITGATETFNLTSGTSAINAIHNSVNCEAVSGDFVIGTGSFIYADIIPVGSAQNINATVSQAIHDWKPYGTASTTEGTVNKGTAGYDSNDFTVTNGFVQLNIPTLSGTVQTIGAVTGDVLTFDLGTTPGTYTFEVDVSAFESGTPLGAGYNMSGCLRTDGASATLIGVPDKNVFEEGALVAGNADIIASGNNMIVRVTGTAGLTVDWSAVAVRVFAP